LRGRKLLKKLPHRPKKIALLPRRLPMRQDYMKRSKLNFRPSVMPIMPSPRLKSTLTTPKPRD
jgi:hypothetical protein